MTDRELPPQEWPRLSHTGLGPVLPVLDPRYTKVAVVEDEEGTIVGCWAALLLVHAEGLWVAEPYRGRTVVARRLWRAMRRVVGPWGAHRVVTGADTPTIAALLEGHGVALPPQYVLPLVKGIH